MVGDCHLHPPAPPPQQKKRKKYHVFSKRASKTLMKISVQMHQMHLWTIQKSSKMATSTNNPHNFPLNSPALFSVILPRCDKAGTHHRKESWAGMRLVFKGRNLQVYGTMVWEIYQAMKPLECGHCSLVNSRCINMGVYHCVCIYSPYIYIYT